MQAHGLSALYNLCWGHSPVAFTRKQRAVDMGAIETMVAALQTHLRDARVQEEGCAALYNICWGAAARKTRAADAGARQAASAAIREHHQHAGVQEFGPELLALLNEDGAMVWDALMTGR